MYTGWGSLDIDAALTLLESGTPLPAPDRYEPNDDAGPWSHAVPPLPTTVAASLDYWDDDVDVYRVYAKQGQTLFARLTPEAPGKVRLSLWTPGTQHVEGLHAIAKDLLARARVVAGQDRLSYVAKKAGIYYLEAKLGSPTHDPLQYRLSVSRRSP